MGIAQAILKLRAEYAAKYQLRPFMINNGLCMDFAAEIANMGFGEDVWGDDLTIEHWSEQVQAFYDDGEYFMSIHCFIWYRGKYYDSECPQGCEYPDQLPCYQRNIDLLADIAV